MLTEMVVCPVTCLFGHRLKHIKSSSVYILMNVGLLSVKKIILMNWKVYEPLLFCNSCLATRSAVCPQLFPKG